MLEGSADSTANTNDAPSCSHSHFVKITGKQNSPLYTMQLPGMWCIGSS